MRIYLLACLGLGLILPMFTLPVSLFSSLPDSESLRYLFYASPINNSETAFAQNSVAGNLEKAGTNGAVLFGFALLITYICGVVYKFFLLVKKLLTIRTNFRNNHRIRKDGHWIISLETETPAFSFFSCIFINKQLVQLPDHEYEKIYLHERMHAKQLHTLDIILTELLIGFFWFNPLLTQYKKRLQEVHEYLADAKTIKYTGMKKSYSRLLLKLTTEEARYRLSSAFSAPQIGRRIKMIGKSRSLPWYRLSFFLLVPMAAFLLLSFSSVENRYDTYAESGTDKVPLASSKSQLKVGQIIWINNTLYTDSQLNDRLGIQSGDMYSKEYLEERLWLNMDAVSSLYMDDGYLFFNAEVEEKPRGNAYMDLNITLYEGIQSHIRHITIEGNGTIPRENILQEILIKEGELFSRSKLIESVRAIAAMGMFDQEKIHINPMPIPAKSGDEFGKVDIEFRLNVK